MKARVNKQGSVWCKLALIVTTSVVTLIVLLGCSGFSRLLPRTPFTISAVILIAILWVAIDVGGLVDVAKIIWQRFRR